MILIGDKLTHPKSDYAVREICFLDGRALEFVRNHNSSSRGELEITTLIEGNLQVEKLGRGTAWLDPGNHNSLQDAAFFVRVLEKRQDLKIACLEKIGLDNQWIDRATSEAQIKALGKSNYGQYLENISQA